MIKRITSVLTAVFMLYSLAFSCFAVETATDDACFSDVSADAWYAEAVAYCRENGLMNGTSATKFSPNESMTRAMLAAVLYRQSGSPTVEGTDAFSDTDDHAWYSDAILWASQQGLIEGYGNGLFGTNHPVTREQIATILWRKEGSPALSGSSERFADHDSVSSYAVNAVAWAKETGVLHGRDGNRFAPKDNASRAEVAAALMNYAKNVYTTPDEISTPSTPAPTGNRVLAAYFSATNTTKPLAEYAADILNADLYEIVPQEPYTADDLAYYTGGRADREQNDPNARPAINGSVDNMDDYNIVFIGYPIWHGQAPRIISTFLESYDFTGKTVIPFCTSHSSGYSDSAIKPLAPGANWITGRRFPGGTSRSTVESWINTLEFSKHEEAGIVGVFDLESKSVTLNSGYTMPINGLGTYSLQGDTCVDAVKSALAQGVRLIDTAHMYGNEEEIGRAIRESMEELGIKREDIFVITKIYPGSDMANPEAAIQACLNRLDIGYVDMMLLHHPDPNDVKAYKAMEKFVEAGKIRSLGLSNWYVSELKSFLPQVNITPALVQNEIHPYYQENDVIPYIQSLGIVVQGWYPLGGRGHTAELLNDPVISSIAQAHGVSPAQVILRWNLQKGVVVIPGSGNPDHIRENTELYHFELSEEEMSQINSLDRNEKHDWY